MHKQAARTLCFPSQPASESSDELDLDPCVFVLSDPRVIALSLKHAAERSPSPLRSAMTMLLSHICHAGRRLSKRRRARLEAAKVELRALFKDAPRRISH